MWGVYLLRSPKYDADCTKLFDCLLLVFVFPLRLFLLFPFVLFARLRNGIRKVQVQQAEMECFSLQSCGRGATAAERFSILQQVVDVAAWIHDTVISCYISHYIVYQCISVVSVTSMVISVISDYISYIACRHQIGINWIEYRV